MGEGVRRQGSRGVDRLTVQEAARRLGVSEGSIRKRVKRGTLDHDKAEDGRVYVYLDAGVDGGVDEGASPDTSEATLISQLREEVAYLREENRRKDAIMLNMTEAMKALSPPAEPSEATQEARESPESPGPTDTPLDRGGGAQEATERPWWRRMFGG